MGQENLLTEAAIEHAYQSSGNTLGWRFLSSPAQTLRGADVAFVGLNPGGTIDRRDHPRFAPPRHSAYATEQWASAQPGASALQIQVLSLFEALGQHPDTVLSGNLVPFRSPDWASLRNRAQATDFGADLWKVALNAAQPRLVIGMGRHVVNVLARSLTAGPSSRVAVGWGRISGSFAHFEGGRLVGLPHLSRFAIINRPQSQAGLKELFAEDWTR